MIWLCFGLESGSQIFRDVFFSFLLLAYFLPSCVHFARLGFLRVVIYLLSQLGFTGARLAPSRIHTILYMICKYSSNLYSPYVLRVNNPGSGKLRQYDMLLDCGTK